jgi:hypothetical protein
MDRAGTIDEATNTNIFSLRVKQFLNLYKSQVKPQTYGQAQRMLESSFIAPISQSDVNKITRSQIVKLLDGMHPTPAQDSDRLERVLISGLD